VCDEQEHACWPIATDTKVKATSTQQQQLDQNPDDQSEYHCRYFLHGRVVA